MASREGGSDNVLALRRRTWGAETNDEGREIDDDELEPLVPAKQKSSYGLGLYSWLKRLTRHYDIHFMMFMFLVQHLTKGFVSNYTETAQNFLYRSYNVPAAQMQIYTTFSYLPWSLKTVLAVISDIFPIAGYSKMPYSMIASFLGSCAFLAIGMVPHSIMPLQVLAVCTFFVNLHIVFSDVLTQGQFTEKVQATKSARLRNGLLTYVWSGIEIGGLVATCGAGPTIQALGAQYAYLFCVVPAIALLAAAGAGYFEERKMTEEEVAVVRQHFWDRKEVVCLSLLTFGCTISMAVAVLVSGSPTVNVLVALVAGAILLFFLGTMLSPTIAKFALFNMLMCMSYVPSEAAEFYFFTDTPEQYPEGPHLSSMFVGTVLGIAKMSGAVCAVFLYQYFSPNWTYRRWFLITSCVLVPCRLSQILLFQRVNLHLGIPDWIWSIGSTFFFWLGERLIMVPICFSISYLSPAGMEVTMFALLMGSANFGMAIGSNVGAWLLQTMGVNPSGATGESVQFLRLPDVAIVTACVRIVFPLIFIWLLPDNMTTSEKLVSDNPDAETSNSIWRRWMRIDGSGLRRRSDARAQTLI